MTMQKSKLMTNFVAIVLLSGASITASYAAEAEQAAPAKASLLAANAAVTDEAITASAKAALSADAQLAGLPISVSAKKGVVMLQGDVPSAEAGDRIVQLVASVAGVKEVKNDLKVKAAG
jgi:hyperosmotically inducible protein